MSTTAQDTCPQCGGMFDFRDGYPDLYGVRLCKPSCQSEWLVRWHYRSTLPDPVPSQITDQAIQQIADGLEVLPQDGDPDRPEDPRKQMG